MQNRVSKEHKVTTGRTIEWTVTVGGGGGQGGVVGVLAALPVIFVKASVFL